MLTYNTIWAAVVLASALTATADEIVLNSETETTFTSTSNTDSQVVELTPYNLRRDDEFYKDLSLGLYRLNCTGGGPWPRDHFCQAVTKQPLVLSNSYVISVKIFDDDGVSSGRRTGHPGIIFTWRDENNYDFVYVRPHQHTMVTGYVLNGVVTLVQNGRALPVALAFDKWFNYKIICISTTAGPVTVTFYVNNIPCSSWTAHFNNTMYAGFGAAHGYENIVWAKDFQVTELDF